MNTVAIILVLLSTPMHAGWNLLCRARNWNADSFHWLLLLTTLLGLVPAGMGEYFHRCMTPTAWICVLLSGSCCGVYYFALARAYASQELTVVYPIARALPILVLGFADILRDRNPTITGWTGMAFIAIGCLVAPLRSFREASLARYLNGGILAVVLAALGTVGYSMLDKIAAETLPTGPGSSAIYGYLYFAVSFFAYAAIVRVTTRSAVRRTRPRWIMVVLAAAMNFGAYWLVLWACQLGTRISYIVAFRQLSIIIGVVLAIRVLGERPYGTRVLATALISIGITLIAGWGE